MTRTELREIIANGENSGVEFQRDTLENHQLAKELVAFLNLAGGMVLLGVDDDGSIAGIVRDDLEEWVMTTCREKIRPGIVPFFETIPEVAPGKSVAIVRVLRGVDVHSQWHQHHQTYYVRVGSQSREPSSSELSCIFQQRSAPRADLRPISGATINDLDHRRLKDYFSRVREQDIPEDGDDAAWQQFLINTQIMEAEGVTLAGMALFGRTPNRFLPQAGIDAAAFPGTEKDHAARERATLHGPMTPLMDTNGQVLETGLVEQALEFVRRNTLVTAVLEDGARRVEKPAYPVEVIREMGVNALVHRDYLIGGTDIELAIYEDRLELISPGKLPDRVTSERMRAGIRATRNQLLQDIMRDYGYLEHMGMGIPRRIVRGMKKHNGTDPDLMEEDDRFVVRLFGRPVQSVASKAT